MTRLIILVFSVFCLTTSCIQKKNSLTELQKTNIRIQKMNNRATNLLSGHHEDTILIKQALSIIDSVLLIKPNESIALHNKFKLKHLLNDIEGMLKTNNLLIKRNRIVDPELLIYRGIIYEVSNETDSAKIYYELGLKAYRNFFKEVGDSNSPWETKVQFAESLAFAGYHDEANEQLKSLKKTYYNHPYIKNCKLRKYQSWLNMWLLHYNSTDYTKQ